MPRFTEKISAAFENFARRVDLDLSIDTSLVLLWTVAAAIVAILAAQAVGAIARRRIDRQIEAAEQAGPPPGPEAEPAAPPPPPPKRPSIWLRLTARSVPAMAPLINIFLVFLGAALLYRLGYDLSLLRTLQPLIVSWLIVGIVYAVTHSVAKTTFIAVLLAPGSLPFLQPYLHDGAAILQDLSFNIGKSEINALMIFKLVITGILLLWMASAVKDGVNASLGRLTHVRWSTRQLLQNLSTIAIYALAILIALSLIGIDLTAFAVLGGALGVGIGLGLQKIASNFISGLILLSEQSIQVDDLIEVSGSGLTGLVRHTGARYTLIETLDAREIMIPNDDLVTNRVINWTFTDAKGVLRLDIGVSYESDIELARDQLIEAAKAHPSVLRNPPPNCLLRGFGASSVDFSLFFSVKDVRERRAGIQSEVLFDIWHRFKEHGIDIPYPQMTVHYAPPMDGQDAPATAEAKKTEGKNPVG